MRAARSVDERDIWAGEPRGRDIEATATGRAAGGAAATGGSSAVWFIVLAFVFSWGWLIPFALAGAIVVAGVGWPTHVPALLGPLLTAFVVTAIMRGRPGALDLLHRMVRFKVPLRWWFFAVSPLLLLLLVMLLDSATGQPLPTMKDSAMFSGLPRGWGAVGVGAVLVLMAFGEETGWRGYLLPHLQERYSPLAATLIVATAWIIWYAPMFRIIDTYRSFSPAITVGWASALFCGAIVLSWLYNRSGGGILLVAVWHATYNLISGTSAATGLLAATSTTLVIALAITLVFSKFAPGDVELHRSRDLRTTQSVDRTEREGICRAALRTITGAIRRARFALAPCPICHDPTAAIGALPATAGLLALTPERSALQVGDMRSTTDTHAFFLTNLVANRLLVPVLRRRVGARLGRRLAVVQYQGRRTGKHRQLVTQYTRDGQIVSIEVGMAERKTWWRNFRTTQPLRLRLAGHDYEAMGHALRDGSVVHVIADISDTPAGVLP